MNMASSDSATPLRIFLPHTCLYNSSGYLVGVWENSVDICCITALIHDVQLHPIKLSSEETGDILGTWTTSGCCSDLFRINTCKNQSDSWLKIVSDQEGNVPDVKVTLKGGSICHKKILVVLYDTQALLSSYFLCDQAVWDSRDANRDYHGNIVSRVISNNLQQSKKLHTRATDGLLWTHLVPAHGGGGIVDETLKKLTMKCLHSPIQMFNTVNNHRLTQTPVITWLASIPCVFGQIAQRCQSLQTMFTVQEQTPKHRLRWRNTLGAYCLDVMLGVTLLLVLLLYVDGNPAVWAADLLMTWAQDVVGHLQRLLHWLMGAPAGLKLNSQLDQFMGKFFLYHIQLWTAYLKLLQPVLASLLWGVAYTGVCGLSFQVALLQDLVAMMSLHIYCFYVYAARLYSLQVSGLGSLWRLFRGKKWNVLRQRVDSACYDVDQLFMGTLLFTILLFLLPTTAMYYVVFTGLRLVIIALQGILYKLRCVLNQVPVYAMLGRLFSSNKFTTSVCFQVVPKVPINPVYLSMKLQPASWSEIWQSASPLYTEQATHSWSDLMHRLIHGKLIYPWIKPSAVPTAHGD